MPSHLVEGAALVAGSGYDEVEFAAHRNPSSGRAGVRQSAQLMRAAAGD
jgi:hypothetical protein